MIIDNKTFPWKKFFFDEFWEPIIILDSKYNIFDINTKFLELSGYSKDELIGQSPNFVLEHIFADHFSISDLNAKDIYNRRVYPSRLVTKVGLKIPIKMAFQIYNGDTINESKFYLFSFIKDISYETHLFRQLNATKLHAINTNLINSVVYRQTSLGPDTWYLENLHFIKKKYTDEDEISNEILKIGLILTTALGQGGAYTTGLSEIPIYDYEVVSVCYTKILKDITATDERLKHKTYAIIAIFFPKTLTSLIAKREDLEKIYKEKFESITDIKQINEKFIIQLKKSVIQVEEDIDSIDFLF